jgi:hypothetical protein
VRSVLSLGKPTVIILVNGGAVALEDVKVRASHHLWLACTPHPSVHANMEDVYG